MKAVTVAQPIQASGQFASLCIEQPVGDIDHPYDERKYEQQPARKMNLYDPGEPQSPHDCDGGGIQTGQVPYAQG